MKQWIRTCQACDYELKSSAEPSQDTKAKASYGYRKCPKCKSEAFDYGSWRGHDTKPWCDKWKALTGRELVMPETELDDLIDNMGDEGLFADNILYQHLINLGH